MRDCLAALAASTHAAFEVCICENGGPEALALMADALPDALPGGQRVRLIEGAGNPGYAGGVNLCIRAAPEADAWWVLNPDTCPDPQALAALVARLEEGDVDAVGGVLCDPGGSVQALSGGRWRGWLARCEVPGMGASLEAMPDRAAVERELAYISGASLLAGRRFAGQAGLMREDYFLYAEEVEWCLRGGKAGMRLGFAPGARVLHAQGATTGSAAAVRSRSRLPIYLDERNRLHVVRDTAPRRLPVAALGALALIFLRFACKGAWRQTGHALAGWLAGLRNERGKPDWVT